MVVRSQAPFIVYSLPRSRSAWIARFLSYGEKRCGHDVAPRCTTVQEFVGLLGDVFCGTVETGAVIGWRAIRKLRSDLRIVVIRRPVQQVHNSLVRFGLGGDEIMAQLRERDVMLDRVARQPGVLSFTFDSLKRRDACRDLFEFCLGLPFDESWWNRLASVNVQINVAAQIQYLADHHERIAALKADAKRIAGEDVAIGPEPWDSVWPEIDALFREHYAEVEGELAENRPYKLNEPRMRTLYANGFLRIVTARINGELAGYCMWIVSPDVESDGMLIAEHGPWYVRPQFASFMLGPKLFDASLADLKKHGVHWAYPHHRLKGRGARLGSFFKRRGAVETQHTYALCLMEPRHA